MKTSFLFLKSSDSSTLNIDSINQRRDEMRLIGSSVAGESAIKVIRRKNLIEEKRVPEGEGEGRGLGERERREGRRTK